VGKGKRKSAGVRKTTSISTKKVCGLQIDEKLTSGLIIYSPVSKVDHEFP